jgi:hypothetical protein
MLSTEEAKRNIEIALKRIFILGDHSLQILSNEIERAKAHANIYYHNSKATLDRAYMDIAEIEPYMPTCLCGPAGVGKTQLSKALIRIFGNPVTTNLGPDHGDVINYGYSRISIGSQRSISQILRPLAKPEISAGKVRVFEADLPNECGLWQAKIGGCLFGIDEMQFISQSSNASTLASNVLLACAEVKLPWFFVANYSLIWKFLDRPPEIRQRLLHRPVVLLPDSPDSEDWKNYLTEVDTVLREILNFNILEYSTQLWNYTGGIKRLVVLIILLSYVRSRDQNSEVIRWTDFEKSYISQGYMSDKKAVEELIAYSIQGGDLRKDLRCPFPEVREISEQIEKYKEHLRNARNRRLIESLKESAINKDEKIALKKVTSAFSEVSTEGNKVGVKRSVPKAKTVVNLQEAAKRFKDSAYKSSD